MKDKFNEDLWKRAIAYIKSKCPECDEDAISNIVGDAYEQFIKRFDFSKVNIIINTEPHWNYLKIWLNKYFYKHLSDQKKSLDDLARFYSETSNLENEDSIEFQIRVRENISQSPFRALIKFTIEYDKKHSNNKIISTENSGAIIISKYIYLKNAFNPGKDGIPQFKNIYKPNSNFIKHYFEKGYLPQPISPDTYFTTRHKILKEFTNRKWMETCILKLKEGKKLIDKFREEQIGEKESNNALDKGEKRSEIDRIEKKWDNIPMLSALALDKDGHFIASCHTGEIASGDNTGDSMRFQKHCEYTLFKEIVSDLNKDEDRLKGGTLFITLEPCTNMPAIYYNTIGSKIPESEVFNRNIPSAVQCLESGISKIFIGNYNTAHTERDEGICLLKSGCYTFKLKNGEFCYFDPERGKLISENELTEFQHKSTIKEQASKSIEAQKALKDRFENKMRYEIIEQTLEKLVYRINEGIDVKFFHPDLIEEITEINSAFLQKNDSHAFREI
ncbi:MAG: hypothetical protein WC780_06085 [Lentimicrobiaceae bacterium]|jgi:hypothetical protein